MSQSLKLWWEMLHITEARSIQTRIDTVPKEKALHAAAEDSAHQGQSTIKNGPIAEINSLVMDLVAFKVKAKISAASHQVSEAESARSATPRD